MSKKAKLPKVSIVTPSYNCGDYIEYCIESVLSQDYPNVEHIIQDSNSTDRTKNILKKYQQPKYKNKIKIFIEKDNGQSDGLNRAIQRTSGDVILVLNTDDILLPHAASWAIENLKKYPEVGAIYGDMYIINPKGEITDIYKADDDYSFDRLLCVELVPPAQASFIRRNALQKVGFFADKDLDTCPDYEMWVRLCSKFPIKHVWGVVTKYRLHDSPQLDSKQKRTVQRCYAAKRIVMDRLLKNPETPEETRKLVKRAYSSLDFWSFETAMTFKQYDMAGFYLLRSFARRPKKRTFDTILYMFRLLIFFMIFHPFRFIKILFQTFRYSH